MTDAREPVLSVRSIATGYGDLRVVWDVSFDVLPGAVFGILGRNGAGKTTTLRAIAGLNPLHDGSIFLQGEDLGSTPTYKRVSRGLGYVQEGKRIIRDLTVEENLILGHHSGADGRSGLSRRLADAYDMFPVLGSRRKTVAGLMSGGQQQMLAIAQALMSDPKVLLVDEPSGGLAPAVVGDVLATLVALRDRGLTIVLVEQSVDFALSVASEVLVIDLGRVVYRGSASSQDARSAIQNAYLGVSAAAEAAESSGPVVIGDRPSATSTITRGDR